MKDLFGVLRLVELLGYGQLPLAEQARRMRPFPLAVAVILHAALIVWKEDL